MASRFTFLVTRFWRRRSYSFQSTSTTRYGIRVHTRQRGVRAVLRPGMLGFKTIKYPNSALGVAAPVEVSIFICIGVYVCVTLVQTAVYILLDFYDIVSHQQAEPTV